MLSGHSRRFNGENPMRANHQAFEGMRRLQSKAKASQTSKAQPKLRGQLQIHGTAGFPGGV
jgi:hypothetical protein